MRAERSWSPAAPAPLARAVARAVAEQGDRAAEDLGRMPAEARFSTGTIVEVNGASYLRS